ncbi:MAG TPA: aminoglycoside phosphotransferase family protein [Crinalium sp.]|jgi:aminoglycoside phosphotransferase (APT) family kinase protein
MCSDNTLSTTLNIDVELVRRLVSTQFPQWSNLPITPAIPQGWDNRTFRLGKTMSVRLPSAVGYTPQIEKEHRYLPCLAPLLPLPIPIPVAKGKPGEGYPWSWSIYRWLPGKTADSTQIADHTRFAITLAHFLVALQQIDPTDGPTPGSHNAFRGGPLTVYDDETRRAIRVLDGVVNTEAAIAVWDNALAAPWHGQPVWFHGDVAVGNLLILDGRLSAVIDFGCSGVGDPACDMVIAWTLLEGESRAAFRTALRVDEGIWARGRGWALWKALITLVEYRNTNVVKAAYARRVIEAVLADAVHHTQ